MSDTAAPAGKGTKKRTVKPILIGVALMPLLCAGGFFLTYKRLIPIDNHSSIRKAPATRSATFVPVPPIIVSLGTKSAGANLRFTSNLEVAEGQSDAVKALMPRILDVLNSYLRAVDISSLEDPAALARLRAQMLRRVQIVTGAGHVRDLLVTQFVLN